MYIFAVIVLIGIIAAAYLASQRKSSDDDGKSRLENDARRFARLLVSEIKLYNEQKVQLGAQNKNLSDALRDEIAAARMQYRKRIADADSQPFFDDALVEILADGDRSKFDSGINSSLR